MASDETREGSEQAAGLDAAHQSGGAVTYRVAVNHADDDHDVAPVAFYFGSAYNAAYADTAAEVLGIPASDVDLLEQAQQGADRAREAYPESEGYEVWVDVIEPTGDTDDAGQPASHHVRRLEG